MADTIPAAFQLRPITIKEKFRKKIHIGKPYSGAFLILKSYN